MKLEQHKVRKSKIKEEAILEMIQVLSERYVSHTEIITMANKAGLKSGIESILSLFNVRGYQVAEILMNKYDVKQKKTVRRTLYKIMTEEDYKKYDEEAHKDAKRRLLAAVSY